MKAELLRQQEAQKLLDRLRSQASEERLRAAKELREMGVHTRGAVRTRGAVNQTASKPIQALDLTPAMEAISDAHWEVRREVALALGEWGDEVALEVLKRLTRNDSEWRVREAVAEALATIGGAKAVDLLTDMVKTDPHPRPAERALKGLGDLALVTWPDKLGPVNEWLGEAQLIDDVNLQRTAMTGPIFLEPSAVVRTRGAVRVRGASPSRRINPDADALLALLDEARFRHPNPSVREVADDTLARLDE